MNPWYLLWVRVLRGRTLTTPNIRVPVWVFALLVLILKRCWPWWLGLCALEGCTWIAPRGGFGRVLRDYAIHGRGQHATAADPNPTLNFRFAPVFPWTKKWWTKNWRGVASPN